MILFSTSFHYFKQLAFAALIFIHCSQHLLGDDHGSEPRLTPTESLSRLKTHDDLAVDLVAAEPLIEDPVAIDFGWDGCLWVADVPDYTRPLNAEPDKGGSVRLLTDRDHDGRFDEVSVFQDGLRFPFDVKVWRDGIIVCDAPDVIYLEDTDGDQKADVRKVLLTGFGDHNAQARVNSLRWGVDGWLYGSCGLFGGQIKSFNGQTLELGDRDFRFHPDTGVIEPVTGRTQQSRVCDAAGNWFGCNSGTMLGHYPLSEHYLARNSYLAPPPVQAYSYADSEELFPAGNPTVLKLSGPPGRPTSACGLEIYRDELLGQQYAGNSFTAEPVNLLVHRRVLAPDGVSFSARRADNERDREFLTSTDSWFRPVQIRTGLDGCLWVVDMHRSVIEHPTWISAEALETLDPSAGNAEARIFRIRPKDGQPRPIVDLRQLSTADLVAALDSPNGPQRDLVQQLILQRKLREAAPYLEAMLATSKRAEARLAALNALGELGALNEKSLLGALRDPHDAVRAHAIRLSERFFDQSPTGVAAVLALASDDAPQVKLQLAYSLGEYTDARAADALAELAWKHQSDPYLLAAAWSSLNERNIEGAFQLLAAKAASQAPTSPIIDDLSMFAAKFGKPTMLPPAVQTLAGDHPETWTSWRVSGVANLLESLNADRRNEVIANNSVKAIVDRLTPAAHAVLDEPDSEIDHVLAALQFLGAIESTGGETIDLVASLLEPRHAPELQLAAMKFLSASHSPQANEALLSQWSSYSPAMRSHVLDVIVARKDFLLLLFEKLKSGDLRAADIDATHRLQLLRQDDAEIRRQAESAFGAAVNADRRQIVEDFQSATNLNGDSGHGAALFQKHCSSCHKLGDVGSSVGPDLAAITSRTPSALIESIFDPNRNVEEKYLAYTAASDDGLAHTGILVSESATSITLVEQQGKQSTLLRESLEALQATGLSLMPEGFEKDLTPQDVADLMAHLTVHAHRPREFEGNKPEIVHANDDGNVMLLASNAEIYGTQILYAPASRSIGDWYDQFDYVAWNVSIDADQEFDLYLDAAGEERTTGNGVAVDGFEAPIRFTAPNTGGFDKFVAAKIGKVRLRAGKNRIIASADGPMASIPLLAIRGIYLIRPGASIDDVLAAEPTAQANHDASTDISKLLDGLVVGEPSEAERIPQIWQFAIAAGSRNNDAELVRLLELSLPKIGEPLRDWQAVVVGGGIINGMSGNGAWPRERMLALVAADKSLAARWKQTLELAAAMADNDAIHLGVRYDALRILGADSFESANERVSKYLLPGVVDDLQMGAISAMADMDHAGATSALLNNFSAYTAGNRGIAFSALLRTDDRTKQLLDSLESSGRSTIALTLEQIEMLKKINDPTHRQRVIAIFGDGQIARSESQR